MKSIKFVDVGEGIQEGKIQKWLVKDGDTVKEDQPLVQIETDKAVVNIPSPVSGKVKIVAAEGTVVKVGDDIAYVGDPSDSSTEAKIAVPAQPTETKQATPQQGVAEIEVGKASGVLATPAVRKLARESGIDISNVKGTGPHGRVLESDLHAASPRNNVSTPTTVQIPKFSGKLEAAHGEKIERIQMSQTRKAIARNMELSWTIPRAVHMDIVDATHLFNIVMDEKQNAQKLGVKLTFLPFIIKATVEALKENPGFNASYDKEKQEIILKKYYNIGLAAEASDGLKVVVIKEADKKSIMEIAKEIEELHKKISDMSITLEEMQDSTFTITNIGSLGGGYLSVPMINYPEVAILGIHRIRDVPVVRDGNVAVGKQLPFSLTFDHRVVDGAEAVKFGNALIEYLHDPEFLEMLG